MQVNYQLIINLFCSISNTFYRIQYYWHWRAGTKCMAPITSSLYWWIV